MHNPLLEEIVHAGLVLRHDGSPDEERDDAKCWLKRVLCKVPRKDPSR